MFEVPGHLWMDLAQPGLGLSILDDGSRLGRSVRGNTMALSLLRQTKFPDPTADRGIHNFAYGICPHAGCWRAAAIPAEAEAFGCALRVATAPAGGRGEVADGWQALSALNTDETSAIEVSALKRADDGKRHHRALLRTPWRPRNASSTYAAWIHPSDRRGLA